MRNFHFLNSKKSIYFFVPILVLLFLLGITFLKNEVRAAVIVVDDPTGEIADNGLCSLPEAIINANNDDQSGSVDCAAGSGADVISLAADIVLSLEYLDNLALPVIEESLVIEGNGFSISRDVLGDDMQLAFFDMTGDFTLRNVTISNFSTNDTDTPSGVLVPGASFLNITIENSVFTNNIHGLIYTDNGSPGEDHWIIRDSVFQNNSAPFPLIRTSIGRDITIENSIFENNEVSGAFDGPILLYINIGFENVISISDSIFRNNKNDGFGGSLGFSGFLGDTQVYIDNTIFENESSVSSGGTISIESFSAPVNFYISNSIFNGNHSEVSGGAIYMQDWVNLNLENNLFIDNSAEDFGGAIFINQLAAFPSVLVEARHNTFVGNIAGNSVGNDIYVSFYESGASGAFSFFENNIFNSGGDECAGDLSNFTFNNNLSNDADCGNLGPVTGLGPLGLYFGSDIPTLRLLAGSNAIDTAVPVDLGCPDEDMIGQIRPNGVQCDIGAFEYYAPGSVIVGLTDGDTVVSEDGTDDTYTLVLSSEPSSSVTIDFDFDNSKISISPSSVTFSTLDWNIEQVVTVSAVVDDTHYENKTDIISHTSSSSDYLFNDLAIDQVTVLVENIHFPPTPPSSGSSGGGSYSPPVVVPDLPIDVFGCTNSSAKNFNSLANVDNGSCQFDVFGCTNPSATNFNFMATVDDGSCVLKVEEEITQDDEPTPQPLAEVQDDDFLNNENTSIFENVDVYTTPSEYVDAHRENKIFERLNNSIESIPEEVSKISSVVGVSLPALAFMVTQPGVAASIPIRLWNIIPTLLGFKRRKRPWGTVYDSVTKQPIDPAYVSLIDLNGNVIANTITDIDGRFGFLVPAGTYKIVANKTDYVFPSEKMLVKQKDELYHNLYFGDHIIVKDAEDVIIKNVPMDSKSFNWNEFTKSKNKNLMKFYSKADLFIASIANIVFFAGLMFSLFALFTAPSTLNYIVIGIYAVFILFKIFGVVPKKVGRIFDEKGYPLSYGVVRVFSSELGREVAHTVIGKTGKYYILVSNGEYYVKIYEKISENEYKEVFTSDHFVVKNGYIGKSFKF